ncbi:MAG: response regulator transcription factor [Bacteriovoracaceae bacterium]|nr:response regulator transcription factor [Bacteriovoracaceae bacterium]
MSELIHIIEDDEDIQELLSFNLIKAGYHVQISSDGVAGLKKIKEYPPQLVLLDLMLPLMDGLEVCHALKSSAQTKNISIIMLTAKGSEEDIVKGLELGADDYVTKPFNPKVLLARVQALLRRNTNSTSNQNIIEIHALKINQGKREIFLDGILLNLTFSEFAILSLLCKRPGWVFTRGQIVAGIRGHGYSVTERAIDVQIVGLRKKLGIHENYIETIRGVGYRFMDTQAT